MSTFNLNLLNFLNGIINLLFLALSIIIFMLHCGWFVGGSVVWSITFKYYIQIQRFNLKMSTSSLWQGGGILCQKTIMLKYFIVTYLANVVIEESILN